MRVTIIRAGQRPGEVFFSSAYGEGTGKWLGSGPAAAGEEWEAEIEISELLIRWVNVLPSPGQPPSVTVEEGRTVLTGTLEDIEEDGTGYLRLGESLILFECLGEPMALGGAVQLRPGTIGLYPVSL